MRSTSTTRLVAWLAGQASSSVAVLLGASLLLFIVVRAAPGEAPARLFLADAPGGFVAEPGPQASSFTWLTEYGAWLSGVLQGDFGRSTALQTGRPAAELLLPAAARSLKLGGAALLLAAFGALGVAWYRSSHPYARRGEVVEGAAHLLSTVPVFLYVYVFVAGGNGIVAWGARDGWWNLPAWFPLPAQASLLPWLAAAVVLATGDGLFLDLYYRFRSELDRARREDHLVGARLLGCLIPRVVARGALPGVASHLARRVGFVLGSLIVLESALGWPGLGYLAWRSAAERDLPVLLGVALLLAVVVRVSVVAAEAAWYVADPRKRALR